MHDAAELESIALYRLLFERAPDATFVFDAQGRPAFSNLAAAELPAELIARLAPSEGEGGAFELEQFGGQLNTVGRAYAEICVDGRTMAIDGRSLGAGSVIHVRDLTERRRLETELASLRRLESIGHFTTNLVHDLNNLLTPIACLSGCLEAELPPAGAAHEMVRDIRSAAEKAAELARQTLRWVRRVPALSETLDVGAVVSELAPIVERVVGTEVRVRTMAATNSGAVSLDRERLEHALLNLAANARDAMPTGGDLTLSVNPVSFEGGASGAVEGARPGTYVALRVTDTGTGMTREVRERLFQRLFTTKESDRGTGLGLDAVKNFIAESGGCIAVQSEEGRGTTVSLYFPVVALDPPPSVAQAGAEPGGAEVILVVDDDDRVRGAVGAVLQSRGYRVAAAGTGQAALEIARSSEHPVDVAVVDVVLADMSGLELARRLREIRPTRVLFTSGHTERRLERCGWSRQHGPLLRKAFTPADLLTSVRRVLDARDAPRFE
jgi:signal transduction histidine kinase/CheY-like chemotaxis protein